MDQKGVKEESSVISQRTAEAVIKLLTDTIPNKYHVSTKDIQILAPMRHGNAGTNALNKLAQEALNPTGPALISDGCSYRVGDRIMQIKIDYKKGVFNGDIGYIMAVNTEKKMLKVAFLDFDENDIENDDIEYWKNNWEIEDDDTEEDFDIENLLDDIDYENNLHSSNPFITYTQKELDCLELSYAITIHKSQGSEYPAVIMPLLFSHFVMLERNLLYTGVTRAKKYLFLEGQPGAVYKAVNTTTMLSRNSNLRDKLCGTFGQFSFPLQQQIRAVI